MVSKKRHLDHHSIGKLNFPSPPTPSPLILIQFSLTPPKGEWFGVRKIEIWQGKKIDYTWV